MIMPNMTHLYISNSVTDKPSQNFLINLFTVDSTTDELLVKVYFAVKPKEFEEELIEVAITEIIADFPELSRINKEIIVSDNPISSLDHLKLKVYQRFEED